MSTASDRLTFGNRIGIFILAEISAVSASAVITILAYIAYSAVRIRSGSRRRWRIESPVHLFLLNQLACDLIQALGGLMNLKWTFNGAVHQGPFCVAQGLIKQVADMGTSLSAGNVAIYTFSALILRLKPFTNVFGAVFIVAGIWMAIILNVAINVGIHGASRFYGPTGYWCWIAGEFPVQQIVAAFMWKCISAFSSLLAYVAVFLVLRGFITVEGWHVRWTCGKKSPDIPQYHILAYKMLAYPIIYIITVLPLAAVRYRYFAGHAPPSSLILFADGLFLSSGLLNVLLYVYTRPFLLPHSSDNPDNQSVTSEFAPSQSDPPNSTILGNTRVVERCTSPIESKKVDPAYDGAPTMPRLRCWTLPITPHADSYVGHSYDGSGETLILPTTTNIFNEV